MMPIKQTKCIETIRTCYRYIEFGEVLENMQWSCINREHQTMLALISYYPRWRRWVMEPCGGTMFSVDCLQDVIHFMGQLKTGPMMNIRIAKEKP